MDDVEILPHHIKATKHAIEAYNADVWSKVYAALEITEMNAHVMLRIIKHKEWFPCCHEGLKTLGEFIHVISQEHIAWRYGLSPERFAKASNCLKVIEVLGA